MEGISLFNKVWYNVKERTPRIYERPGDLASRGLGEVLCCFQLSTEGTCLLVSVEIIWSKHGKILSSIGSAFLIAFPARCDYPASLCELRYNTLD